MITLSNILTALLIATAAVLIFALAFGFLVDRYRDHGPGDPPLLERDD